ncbi:DUF805 domain-containing protein [Arthrobacter sp. YN]|uniref:DUF805 domain-containing protein n=1 Tax=Arthrobacter sp. YN TaxID=2020486 RepID=UPI000B5E76B2|nr:DUF805 domain-containing protein [Arthrobacter sp. YN]ASN20168.1 hypothetical protein CGK93_11180 [Arthrobacter sp. YN]
MTNPNYPHPPQNDDVAAPLYGARIGQAISRFFRKYTVFHGRASRSEFWWVALAHAALSLIPAVVLSVGVVIGVSYASSNQEPVYYNNGNGTQTLLGHSQPGILENPTAAVLIFVGAAILALLFLATVVPFLALSWRRLHDANFPGPFYFFSAVPFIGSLILLFLLAQPSKDDGRRFDRPVTPDMPLTQP